MNDCASTGTLTYCTIRVQCFSIAIGTQNGEIYKRIDADLDRKGLEKKKIRLKDKMYLARQTGLLSEEFSDLDETSHTVNELEIGRPRISHKIMIFSKFII